MLPNPFMHPHRIEVNPMESLPFEIQKRTSLLREMNEINVMLTPLAPGLPVVALTTIRLPPNLQSVSAGL